MSSLAEPRAYTGWLYDLTWEFEEGPCFYVGNRQAGPIYEVTDPNDGVIENIYSDYKVDSAFSEENYAFGLFSEDRCMATAVTTSTPATTVEITTREITTPDITTPEITTPEITTREITTPEITTPEITTPEITTPEITTPEITTPEITTPPATTPPPPVSTTTLAPTTTEGDNPFQPV